MPRDYLLTSVQAGSALTVNADATQLGGDIILHQGVPYVAWCEVVPAYLSASGASEYYGPYLAMWTGSDWLRIGEPPLPTGYDPLDFHQWPPANDANVVTTNPVVARGAPKLASDGENVYVGVVGSVMERLLNPPLNPFFIYSYWEKQLVYGFQLSGGGWTTIGDEIFGVFPETIGSDEPYDTEDRGPSGIWWDISASPDNVGNCYFAMSDAGTNAFPSLVGGQSAFYHFSVAGTDLAETSLATDAPYALTLDGGGSTFALYYFVDTGYGPTAPLTQPDTIFVWTTAGTDTIDISMLEPPDPAIFENFFTADTYDGVRYLVFNVSLALTGGGTQDVAVVQTVDPAAPADLQHLDARISPVTGRTLDYAIGRGFGSATPITFVAEPSNYWLGVDTVVAGVPDTIAKLDRQCGGTPAWTEQPFDGAGRMVVYQDALWWFIPGADAAVFRRPICRGCEPCPKTGLHVWRKI